MAGDGAPAAAVARSTFFLVFLVILATLPAGEARAALSLESYSATALRSDGTPETRAGLHPDTFTTLWRVNVAPTDEGMQHVTGLIKNIHMDLPPGFVGNLTKLPICTPLQLNEDACPLGAQVGETRFVFQDGEDELLGTPTGIFNTRPSRGEPAALGFNLGIYVVRITFNLRTGSDYGITATVEDIPSIINVRGVETTLWGVPAEHNGSGLEAEPFLAMPTSCDNPLSSGFRAGSWEAPQSEVALTATLPALGECGQVPFEPSLEARPTTAVADSASGLNLALTMPEDEDPLGRRSADLRDVTVTLPRGITLNPAGANGLAACAAAQFDIHGPGPGDCPDASKIGSVELESPLVDHPLPGGVYVAAPHDNPFGSLVALYLGVEDPQSGIVIKVAGRVELDPQSGQITARFSETPQLPFEHLRLHLFKGAQAPLRTPSTCGIFETTSSLTPWSAPDSGPPAAPRDRYLISPADNIAGRAANTDACPATEAAQPNAPAFEAGSELPRAGTYSPFVVRLHREDGSQRFRQLTITPPAGLLAKLAGTPYCSDPNLATAAGKSGRDEQANPSCPSASAIGTVTVAAGAGPSPYWVSGTAYLAGPYKSAPLSLAVVTPAVAGPFDLGTVVVRAAVEVDPETAQVTVKSDPFPTILEGIPLDLQTISVRLDRSRFIRNPTSCDPLTVGGALVSTLNQFTALASRFQLGECRELSFRPRLSLRFFGPTRRGGHPKLRTALRVPPGGANTAKAAITLPEAAFVDQRHIRALCTRTKFSAGTCPRASVYGRARVFSPLLGYALRGPVFLRSSDRPLPDVVARVKGPDDQPVEIDLAGRTDSVHGAMRITFDHLPDVPIRRFEFELFGGKRGLIELATDDYCSRAHRAEAVFVGQALHRSTLRPVLRNSRCSS